MKKSSWQPFALMFAGLLLFLMARSVQASDYSQDDVVSHGKYIATLAGCTSCHTPLKPEFQNPQELSLEQIRTLAFDDLQASDETRLLAGGRGFDLGPAGIVFSRNITPDEETGIGTWTDDQIKVAMKTGIDHEGQLLFPVMPYHVYNGMADEDVDAVIAYIHTVQPVKNEIPERTVSTEGLPTLSFESGIIAPDTSDLNARGEYLVNHVMGCTDCHTPVDPSTGAPQLDKYLAGRQPYEGPWGIVYGGNITPDEETGIGAWSDDEVKRALLHGIAKDGRRLILMPWYAYTNLTPEDADAVVYYLKHGLQPVRNEIPKASLNEGFMVIAPSAQNEAADLSISPVFLAVVSLLVVLFVSYVSYSRRQPN